MLTGPGAARSMFFVCCGVVTGAFSTRSILSANRAGCALMYLAQRAKGQERENYLKEAIEKYSDCFYGDGVQVGAYARLFLADYYLKTGKPDEAKALLEQLRKDYPDAISHDGRPLVGIGALLHQLGKRLAPYSRPHQ